MNNPHLNNPPITEALIDLQVAPAQTLTYEELAQAFNPEEFGYYLKSSIAQGLFQFGMASGGASMPPSSETKLVGLRLHSKDEKYVAQFRLNGFTLSRMPPYEKWEKLLGESKRLWKIYIQALSPESVLRIAVRYINNLELPMQLGDSFQDYINKMIDIPDEAPQNIEAFLQRFHLIDLEEGNRSTLTLALDGNPQEGVVSLILDIDAYRIINMDLSNSDVWNILERLRHLKNRIFFGTITSKTKELYK